GEQPRPAARAATVQRCFRTTDIEEVGDLSHCTAFEMLGNFSFGDYFKSEAIGFAWELLTKVYQVPAERLHMTIYLDDDDAYDAWRTLGVPDTHIHRCDEEKNYWFSGPTGPCGPDSEIYYDFYPERGLENLSVAYDDERFLEIWNLVFMQLYQHEDGSRTPLPTQNIDTGSGLERVAAVQQGKRSVFETDIFLPILETAAAVAGVDYFSPACTPEQAYAIRAMSEHCRAAALLIGDGVVPSNEGRGYVLRRIIRRAIYFARSIGVTELFTARVALAAIDKLRAGYPHLEENRAFIEKALSGEEERFIRTLGLGQHRLEAVLERATAAGTSVVPGADAFLLYDTFGLPLELTREIASRQGFTVDDPGFQSALEEQRTRARQQGKFFQAGDSGLLTALEEHSAFVGYTRVDADAHIMAILKNGQLAGLAIAGEECSIVLDITPFYPEGGGQIGDHGNISTPSGVFIVEDTQSDGGAIVHRGRVLEGEIRVAENAQAIVDLAWRTGSARNHTGTHLLHAALRRVLGSHVRQQGSLVGPDRLRFDYTHLEQTPREALAEAQHLANSKVRSDLEVGWRNTTYRQAVEGGALAFFGDKYGSEVRVVEVRDADGLFSAELCGGTHVHHTGELGFVHIVRESAVAAGTRRIEALTGAAAETYLVEQGERLARLAGRLSTSVSEVEDRVEALQSELESLRKQNQELERARVGSLVESLLEHVESINESHLLVARIDTANSDTLRETADRLRQRVSPALILLGGLVEGRPAFLAAATPDLVQRGIHAGNLVRDIAKAAGGGGGGRPDIAQAGAKDASRLDEALAEARRLGRAALGG
ncbi:MAG: alanine--tRNA ligase, partial [Tepidiformaceae bacterium]